jgi:hypothetical protein
MHDGQASGEWTGVRVNYSDLAGVFPERSARSKMNNEERTTENEEREIPHS